MSDELQKSLRALGNLGRPATVPQSTNPPAPVAPPAPPAATPAPAAPQGGHSLFSLQGLKDRALAAGPMGAVLAELIWEAWQAYQAHTEKKINESQADQIKAQAETDLRHDQEIAAIQAAIKELQAAIKELLELANQGGLLHGPLAPTPPPAKPATPTTDILGLGSQDEDDILG